MLQVNVLRVVSAIMFCLSAYKPAVAQNYPSREIHLVVGFAAGSGADVIARFFGEKLRARLNTTVVVENRPGAIGNIATEYVARAKPDGYTLYLTGGNGLAATGHLFKKPPVDVATAFDTVALLSKQPSLIVVSPKSNVKTLPELTALLKSKGDKSSYATSFPPGRVLGALYKQAAGLETVEVQYKTARDWINDLNSGAVDFAIVDASGGSGLAREGHVRIVAVSTPQQSASFPGIPTLRDGGVNVDFTGWWGMFAPAGLPADVRKKLNEELSAIAMSAEGAEFLRQFGSDPWTANSEEAQRVFSKEYSDWGDYVRVAKIEPQG